MLSREVYGSDVLFAATFSAEALGAVLGTVLAARWRPRQAGTVAMAGVATMAGLPLALLVAAPIPVVLLAGLVMGIALEPFQVWWMTAIQVSVPREALARVVALYLTGSLALMPAGMAGTGLAADLFGTSAVLIAAAVVAIAVPVLVLRSGRADLRPDRARPRSPRSTADDVAAARRCASSCGHWRQYAWEHCVPKTKKPVQPRMSVTIRHSKDTAEEPEIPPESEW